MQPSYYRSIYYAAECDHKLTYVSIVARRLMDEFGLTRWGFGYNYRKCDLGICFGPTPVKNGRIELSTHFVKLNPINIIHDILLHEIAHALVGCRQGHNAAWKAKAKEIGATPERLCCNASIPRHSYEAQCKRCKKIFYRYRQVKNWGKGGFQYCISCGPDVGYLEFRRVL